MSKKTGIIFIIVGVVLILSALLLYIHNTYEDEKVGRISEDLLADVKSEIAVKANNTATTAVTGPDVTDSIVSEATDEMPVVDIDGYGYIGYISMPKIGIELPVLAEWDYMRLDMAPCRQAGSTVTGDLVIAAHNYTSHFAGLSGLDVGDTVTITDMNGKTISYTVAIETVLDGKAVDEVLNSEYDLVLYTCTYEGTTRVVIFCNRT